MLGKEGNMDTLNKFVVLVTGSLAALKAAYELLFKSGRKRLDAYYEEFLKPFYVAYKKNKNINAVKFIKPLFKIDNDNIPKYILYLMEQKEAEKLKKVLLYDYYELYKNDDNNKIRICDGVLKGIDCMYFVLIMMVTFFAGAYFSYGLLLLIGGQPIDFLFFKADEIIVENNNLLMGICCVIAGFFAFGIAKVMILVSRLLSTDRYSLNIKKIDVSIKEKVKLYDKRSRKWFL